LQHHINAKNLGIKVLYTNLLDATLPRPWR